MISLEPKQFTWQTPPTFTPAKLIPTGNYHYYINPQGIRYPSITTVFSKIQPFESTPAYPHWIKKIEREDKVDTAGAKAIAKNNSRIAMGDGSRVHSVIEHYLNNKITNIKLPLLISAHFRNIKPLLDNIDNISATEIPLYSNTMKLAGTADCIAEYNGVPSIIDFKTSTKKKQESWIENYFLQATAYCTMWEELTKQKIPQIVILISSNDGNLQEFVKKPTDYGGLLKEKLVQFERFRN